MFLLRFFENIVYKLRNIFWDYPDLLFFGEKSLKSLISGIYNQTRPFSHILLSISFCLFIVFFSLINPQAIIHIDKSKYIEGVIVGVDGNNKLLGLTRINPLIPSNVQLERDISNLIYESLIRVNQDGEVENILIDSFGEIKAGNHYRFKLKKGIKWHDGAEFTTEDVRETFYLLSRLNKEEDTSSNYSKVIANQFDDIEVIDDYTFELKLKSEEAVLPSFFESINFPILPAKYISELNEDTILGYDIKINLKPIGTGPFKNLSEDKEKGIITLERNLSYHSTTPNISELVFKLFGSEDEAVESLKSARIHGLSGLTTETLRELKNLPNYQLFESNVIYNQYWALFFNLSQNASNDVYMDKKVRQALARSIDREAILNILLNQGEVCYSTIPKNSFAYKDLGDKAKYNAREAQKLLTEAGWVVNQETGILEKDGKALKIELVYTKNPDRERVALIIQRNFKEIGVDLVINSKSIQDLNNNYILPKQFELLLYGQTTFIGPDRYELFHSSQANSPGQDENGESTGLNISGYVSEVQDREISEEKELQSVPKVDVLLEDGRSYVDREKRKEIYGKFQDILADESPVIFLYHPKYTYVVNKRVKGIKLDDINNLSDRFLNIVEWKIEV